MGGLGLPEFVGHDVVVIVVLIVRLRISTAPVCIYDTHTGSLVPVGFYKVVPEGGSRVEGVGSWHESAGDCFGDDGFAGEFDALFFGEFDGFVGGDVEWEAELVEPVG